MTGVSKGVLSHVVYSMLLHGRHGKVLLYDACHGMVMPRHVNCDMSLVSPHGMRRGQYECCQVFNAKFFVRVAHCSPMSRPGNCKGL